MKKLSESTLSPLLSAVSDAMVSLLVLKHVLRAWRVLDIGLACALVLSVADELESDPELVEQVLQENHPAADAYEEIVASVVAGSVDLVGYRCEIV